MCAWQEGRRLKKRSNRKITPQFECGPEEGDGFGWPFLGAKLHHTYECFLRVSRCEILAYVAHSR
jgi:hypothetical protein